MSLLHPTCHFITQSIPHVHNPWNGYLTCISTGFCTSQSVKWGKDIIASHMFIQIYYTRYSRNLSQLDFVSLSHSNVEKTSKHHHVHTNLLHSATTPALQLVFSDNTCWELRHSGERHSDVYSVTILALKLVIWRGISSNILGEKRIACKQCSYSCIYSGGMKYHMLSHTGEKTFACKKCDYSCTIASRLKTHLLIVSGEKPFSCTQHKLQNTGALCM